MLNDIEKTPIKTIDLDFVKDYLRVDYDHDDALIKLFMKSAESFVITNLGMSFDELAERYGEVPVEITIPYLTIISHWYDRREIQAHRNTEKELQYVFADVLGMFRNWNL